jgi:arginine N-succinyltransferase
MAEIRGWPDTEGRSPFWDAVGSKFFQMDYRIADERSARDHRFIADLMPRYPIYASLLPEEARRVIARPHPDAEPALALLKSQGFHFNNVIDIFDAGPAVEAFTDHIDIVRSAIRMKGREFAAGDKGTPGGFVAAAEVRRFAVTRFDQGEDRQAALNRIGAGPGDEVLVYRSRERAT